MKFVSADDENYDALKELRRRVKDVLKFRHDDYFLLRWLRAGEFDMQKSEKMLRDDMKIRKKLGSDTIVENYKPKEELKPYEFHANLGFDNEGHLVRLINAGGCDITGFLRSMTYTDFLKHIVYTLERDSKQQREHNMQIGKHVEKFTYIADCSGIRISPWCERSIIRQIIQVTKFLQAHYPETLYTAYIINAPTFLRYLFDVIVKPYLGDATLSKMKIFGTNDDSWKNELFCLVPKNTVPKCLGGERSEPDPQCSLPLVWMSRVPSSYYIAKSSNLSLSDPDIVEVTVKGRSFFEVDVDVQDIGCTLCWEFQTMAHDIMFGLFYQSKKDSYVSDLQTPNREVLLEVQHRDCSKSVVKGEYFCHKTGTYTLHFDNTYSWLRSKRLRYKIEICCPEVSLDYN